MVLVEQLICAQSFLYAQTQVSDFAIKFQMLEN